MRHSRNRLSKEAFSKNLAELGQELRELIEAEVDGFDRDPVARKKRIAQGRDSFEFFARTYFPHYIKSENSVVHAFFYKRLPEIVHSTEGERDAHAAPRGEAKSTICSLIFFIWCIVYEHKHNMMLIMDSYEQSAEGMESIKAELDSNPRLLYDFDKAAGQGRVWREGLIVTRNNRKLQGFGTGKKIRGKRHGPHRPDLVVMDDLENDENVQSPEQRNKLESFVDKTVENLSAADDSLDLLYVGTILHYDAVLSRKMENPLWHSQKFQSVIQWPDRMDLWDEWEELLLNDSPETAKLFYAKHKKLMDKGAKVTWPTVRTFYKLMIKRARIGHEAFDSEMQNDPIALKDAPFGVVQFWVNRLADWIFYGSCDPSLGKHGKGRDPSAILVGGFNRETGILDVVEAAIAKRLPDKIIEDIIAMQQEWHCLVWVFEAIQFQEFLRTELVKRSARRHMAVPALPTNPITDKALRIATLQPHVFNGLIRFHPSQKTLLEQLRHWPKAAHDDGPDALEMLWKAIQQGVGGLPAIASINVNSSPLRGYDE